LENSPKYSQLFADVERERMYICTKDSKDFA
jgi:hypothetical protein